MILPDLKHLLENVYYREKIEFDMNIKFQYSDKNKHIIEFKKLEFVGRTKRKCIVVDTFNNEYTLSTLSNEVQTKIYLYLKSKIDKRFQFSNEYNENELPFLTFLSQ